MQPLDTIETEFKGYTIRVKVYHDPDMGEPWKEHDGHGIVSDWETRDKRPGERVLCSDRNSHRFYDFAATMKKAKAEGWGLNDDAKAKLAKELGHAPSKGEILHAAVMADFEYCQGWLNNEWHWEGYITEILTPEGTILPEDHDSCWGYEGTDGGREYMIGEAQGNAEFTIDRDIEARAKEQSESEAMACRDIATL